MYGMMNGKNIGGAISGKLFVDLYEKSVRYIDIVEY